MLNDASAAAGDVVEAASKAASTVSKVVEETSENIEEGVRELQEKKKIAQQIVNRTNKSIDTFENPLPMTNNKTTGGRKTKRSLFKRKLKTKRVRFAI
jgi:ABC-type transporter Mla subunit MlaD